MKSLRFRFVIFNLSRVRIIKVVAYSIYARRGSQIILITFDDLGGGGERYAAAVN